MEQAPGSLDDLQPQDLSASSISTLIDSTRKREGCVSSDASLSTLVRSPGWCPNSASCNPQLTFSESAGSSDVNIQSGDQIHPDNALSHTTVTLSYVSRSHVCITRNSSSQRSPLSSLPAISELPLCSLHHSEALRELNQRYAEPVGPDIPKEHFQSSSQAHLGSENNVPAKESHEVKSTISSRELGETFQEENSPSLKHRGLENGEAVGLESLGILVPATGEGEKTGGCEVFVVSTKPEPVAVPDSIGVRDLGLLNREHLSPLGDPLSPGVVSQDGAEDELDPPQAPSSPGTDKCCPAAAGGFVWDGSCPKGANHLSSRLSADAGPESSGRGEQPLQKHDIILEPLPGATGNVSMSDDSENQPVSARVNGNATALQRSLNEKKVPARPGRGTRLEAIVMNINSSSYTVAGCIHTNQKPNPSRAAECDTKITNSQITGKLSLRKRASKDKASPLENSLKQTVSPAKECKDANCNTDGDIDATSDSLNSHAEKPQNSTPPKLPQPAVHTNSERRSASGAAEESYAARGSPRVQSSKPPKKGGGKAGGNVAPAAAASRKPACAPRSRRTKHKGAKRRQCTSMFSPKEPEIKLRYLTYKEEKRDSRVDSFSPFVHVERQQASPSLCTVVNYPEEVRTELKKGQQLPSGTFATGAVPSTSCVQLGRASVHSQQQRALVCCLCGQSANAMDLGDLHGPYYPEGHRPAAKRPAGVPGLKGEEDDSDSDSSSSTIKERGRKRAVKQPSDRLRGGAQPWAGDGTSSPAAKRAHSDRDTGVMEDWYSPPVLPLEPCEYWLHEDCGIWSAGVYLVRGKVYGLEEAVRVARETVRLHAV